MAIARRVSAALLLFVLLTLTVACASMYPNDTVWISNEQFDTAKTIYSQTSSLVLTRQQLEADPTWSPAEINQAIYRLQKLYRVENVN